MIQAKYTHTNLIAVDWRTLAKFYIEVLGCELVPPERDLRGEPVERGTAIPGVHLSGVHLRLPGVGSDGPTLEIFSYEPLAAAAAKKVNRPGFGHIAFAVEDIDAARAEVLAHGLPSGSAQFEPGCVIRRVQQEQYRCLQVEKDDHRDQPFADPVGGRGTARIFGRYGISGHE